jgi:alkanesulfonate monooxygenase SsuD/methylene tetrahydromethanopterin reductase-like flavin-dependent oxidoreductase (luciferase family)
MLDREGAAGPADVAIIGDEESVAARVAELAAVGATDFVAAPFAPAGSADEQRTRALLRTLAQSAG